MADEVSVSIETDADLVTARAEARAPAQALGFSRTDATLIATAISEIARNIVVHVGRGEIMMSPVREEYRYGLVVVARDEGQGIHDAQSALNAGYTSALGRVRPLGHGTRRSHRARGRIRRRSISRR
jgi:serine/threonine-protein kinase RsbT